MDHIFVGSSRHDFGPHRDRYHSMRACAMRIILHAAHNFMYKIGNVGQSIVTPIHAGIPTDLLFSYGFKPKVMELPSPLASHSVYLLLSWTDLRQKLIGLGCIEAHGKPRVDCCVPASRPFVLPSIQWA
jgi:hypothetical protein